jgi:hypothetical protein
MMSESWPERHIDWSSTMTNLTRTEPVMLYALLAGLLTAVGGALVAIGEGVDPLIAIGTAIISFGLVVGGGGLGRSQAYSPERHHTEVGELRDLLDDVGDAEAAIRAEHVGDPE